VDVHVGCCLHSHNLDFGAIIFARQGKLDDLVDILRRGTVMRFVTVTYIVLVVVTLALVGRMDRDKVSTILVSIARLCSWPDH
jgi:hypothetical protein